MMERMAEVEFLPELTKEAEIKKSAACPHFIDPKKHNKDAISKLITSKVEEMFRF